MKMDRRWIALGIMTIGLMIIIGCSGTKPPEAPPPPPPPPAKQSPPVNAPIEPTAAPADMEEKVPSKSAREIEDEARRSGLLGDVFYQFDKYDLGADARERLAKNAEFMNSSQGSGLSFTIEGHCDERGTNEYNLALGQRRASAALDYLISLGVSRSRFKMVSYGEERPVCTQSNEACWQRNRRARFVVTGTGS